MRNHWTLGVSLIFLLSIPARAQVTIHIVEVPQSTPEGSGLYFASSINNWNPGDQNFMLDLREDGDYWIDLPPGSGQIEFKFTRGSWESVEGNETGGFRPNRTYTYGTADTLNLTILSWEDLDGPGSMGSTANDQVMVWDTAMFIPQLDRYRRVWVYLPRDYETSGKSYRVLYMHDGQNIFDVSTSFAGEWEVDETLSGLEEQGFESAIVVAVDNGGSYRFDEYSPFINPEYGGGEGDLYLDFLIETLMPRVDSTFRTLKGPENTGIMGSSLGGLISHYACFRNPEVFGKIGIFSPSYWFSEEYFTYTASRGKTGQSRIILLAGEGEETIATGTQEMYDLLLEEGFTADQLRMEIVPDGEHSEWFWAREFKDAFMWLFNQEQSTGRIKKETMPVDIFPNPVHDLLKIMGRGPLEVSVFNLHGMILRQECGENEIEIDVSSLPGQVLFLDIEENGEKIVHRVIKK